MANYPKESWISPSVELRKDSISGTGMFATVPVKKGETVVVWGGKALTTDEAMVAKKAGKLVMQWDDDLWTAEDRGDDPSYFINHSCDPNIWMQGVSTLVARRDIAAGEEITADYILWEADENYVAAWDCQCGSPLCRKKITGKDWRLPELQERYRGHFTPLINKRIKLWETDC